VQKAKFNAAFPGAIALLALLLTGCPSSKSPQVQPEKFTFGTTASVSTIDPADAYSSVAGILLHNLGDRLYAYKPGTTELVPQLATSMPKVSRDGLTYVIGLRQAVLFHDGEKFDAKAMAFSLERFMTNGGAPSFLLSDTIDHIKATGEYELTIKLKKPFTAFPSLLAFSGACPISPKAYEIKAGSFKPKEFVGTGPYKLVSFGVDRISLEPFDQYWGDKPKNKGVDIQIFSGAANLFNAFKTGAVDMALQGLAIEHIKALQEQSAVNDWQVIEQAGSGMDYLSLNVNSAPLDRVEVRQAIAAIMDRSVLQDRVFNKQVLPLYSLLPETISEQVPSFQTNYGAGMNVEKARQLLTQAGYSKQNPLKLELWYRSNLTNDQLAAITIKGVVKKKLPDLLQIELNGVDSATAYKNLDKGTYPIFLLDWSPDYLDADSYIQPFVDCAKGNAKEGCKEGASAQQGSFYFNDRVNALIAQSRKVTDPKERRSVYGELQAIVAQDVPFIPLWQSKDYLFVQGKINGAALEATQKVSFSRLQFNPKTKNF
jgi:peptide/nickel transport system substrate-binding protein